MTLSRVAVERGSVMPNRTLERTDASDGSSEVVPVLWVAAIVTMIAIVGVR